MNQSEIDNDGNTTRKLGQKRRDRLEWTPQMREDFRIAFDVLDPDGQGIIDIKDLKDVIRALGFDMKTYEVEKLVGKGDKDGSGIIDYSDFTNFIDNIINMKMSGDEIGKAFREIDHGGKGVLDVQDLRRVAREIGLDYLTDEQLAEMLRDTSKRGAGFGFTDFKKQITKTFYGKYAKV